MRNDGLDRHRRDVACIALIVAASLLAAASSVRAQPASITSSTPLTATSAQPQSATQPPATQPMSQETAARVAAVLDQGEQFNNRPLRREGDAPASGVSATTRAVGTVGGAPAKLDFTRIAAALAIVVGLIIASRVLFKRFFAGASAPSTSRAVKVIGRTSLAPRQQVLLLQVGGRVVVVGESNGILNTLAQIEDPDEVARLIGQLQEEQIQRGHSFGGLFGKIQRRYDDPHSAPLDAHADHPRTQAAALEEEHVGQARSELSGLVDKVRALRSQIER